MRVISKMLALATILAMFSIRAALSATPTVDDQPHMQEALTSLQQARHHLESAIPDKGGHRSAALKACDEAIKHTQEGIQYAKEHP